MTRVMSAVYGLACYVVFLATFLYAIGFVENLVVPKSTDSGPAEPVGIALLVNALLLRLFAIEHIAEQILLPQSAGGYRDV